MWKTGSHCNCIRFLLWYHVSLIIHDPYGLVLVFAVCAFEEAGTSSSLHRLVVAGEILRQSAHTGTWVEFLGGQG